MITDGNLALNSLYENHKFFINSEEKSPSSTQKNQDKNYRTRNRAGKVVDMPDKYAIITNANYKDAITIVENKKAHIQAIKEDKRVYIKDGIICLDGLAATSAEIIELGTNDYIEDVDFVTVCHMIVMHQKEI